MDVRYINARIIKNHVDHLIWHVYHLFISVIFMSNIKNDVLYNRQQKYKQINYYDYDMYSSMDIGNIRTKQEDSSIFLRHPLNKNFKLLAIADGMGGLSYGGIASNITLIKIIEWFDKLPISYYNSEISILKSFKTVIEQIDNIVRDVCIEGGTTLSAAIIARKNTFFFNIGDSRIYIKNNRYLQQISNDSSISWNLFLNGDIKNKDDIL